MGEAVVILTLLSVYCYYMMQTISLIIILEKEEQKELLLNRLERFTAQDLVNILLLSSSGHFSGTRCMSSN